MLFKGFGVQKWRPDALLAKTMPDGLHDMGHLKSWAQGIELVPGS